MLKYYIKIIMKGKNNMLLILLTPPPYHGAAIMNQNLIEKLKQDNYPFIDIPIKASKTIKSIGKFNFIKVLNSLFIFKNIYKNRTNFYIGYLVLALNGFAFYRDILIIFLLKLLNKQVLIHIRVKGFKYKKWINKILIHNAFKNSYLIQHSPLLSFDIEQYNKFKKKFYVPNGLPDVYKNYIQYKDKLLCKTINIIFLSNLFESKGLFILLKAIYILKNKNIKNLKFHFIGNWENNTVEKKFNLYIQKYKIGNLIGKIGPKYNNEKYKFFINMDILVFPTYQETWGNVNLEAMMFKIPIISTYEGAISEIIDDCETGFLVKQRDADALAIKIETLIKNKKLRLMMGENGRKKYLSKYTLKTYIKNMKKIFNNIKKNNLCDL